MDVDLIAEVLRQHRVVDAGRRVPGKSGVYEWRFECSCGWESDPFAPGNRAAEESAEATALMHEAEQVAEAIRLGAPEAPGADPTTINETPEHPVPAAMEAI